MERELSAFRLGEAFPLVEEADAFDARVFFEEHKDRRPVVYRGAVRDWPAAAWTPDGLKARFAERKIPVRRYQAGSDETFLEQTLMSARKVTVGEYVDHLQGRASPLPGAPHEWAIRDAWEAFEALSELYHELGYEALFGHPGWPWVHTLWMGPGGYVTGLHIDIVEVNLLAHVYGKKEMVLFGPSQTEYLYPKGQVIQQGLYSEVDVYAPDLDKHPRVAEAKGRRVDLEPGDLMYVPNGWWHLVRAEEVTISVSGGIERLPR